MTEPCGFAVSVDRALAQVTLRARPTGAAGGATITPRPGVELTFDRIGGWLSRVIVAAGHPGGAVAAWEETVTWLASVFGAATAETIKKASNGEVQCLPLRARRETLSALSRLALLDAARVTSPVPGSPLWAAEAEDLARRTGLSLPSGALSTATAPMTTPENLGTSIPADVMRLLADSEGGPFPVASDEHPLGGRTCAKSREGAWRLRGLLDLGLVPHGVFRPGLWPGSDLDVRVRQHGAPLITMKAALLPGAPPEGLADCRVRLVDAGARRVLAMAVLWAGAPSCAWAELPVPAWLRALARSGSAWVEVVGDERQPVHGTRLRRGRWALRWADAALRAESRPNGLAPELSHEQWTGLAALAWDCCRANWEAADDLGRAGLAATRAAALRGTPGRSEGQAARAPCGTAAGVAVRRALPFLAELVCRPAIRG